MSSKTRKNRKTKPKNITRKNWKKNLVNEARFQIIGKETPLGTNGKFLRIQNLRFQKIQKIQKLEENLLEILITGKTKIKSNLNIYQINMDGLKTCLKDIV